MAQSRCSGLLVFQAAAQEKGTGSYTYGATCYGVTHSVGNEGVDLQQHHETRELSMEYKNAQVYSLHCLGSSIYSSGQAAPPYCLGVEFLRYSQAMIEQQQQQAARRAAAQHHTLPSTSTGGSSSSGGDVAASYHAAHRSSLQQQRDLAEQDAFLQQEGFVQDTFEEQQQQDAEGLVERVQRRREEIHERLEGKDPLWFAKAFANRAALNWESMKRVAGDIAAQAKADLGFEPDETE